MPRSRGRPKGTGEHYGSVRVRLAPVLVDQAELEAQRLGVTPSEWVRRAVRYYLLQGSPPVPLFEDEDLSPVPQPKP